MSNFFTGYSGQRLTDSLTASTYWVYKIPKGDNVLQQGYSDYYDMHPLRHESNNQKLEFAKQPVEYLSRKHGATLCINGVPYGNHGFHGVNIYNGEIRNEITGNSNDDGWNTLAVDDNGDFKYFDPKVTAQEILGQGYNTAFDIMTPVLMDGKEPSNEIKNLWENSWGGVRSPRSVIAQDRSKQYYYFMVFNGRVRGEEGFRYEDLTRICMEHGCYNAYALDGGGSTELIVENKKINYDIENNGTSRRTCPHVLYVGKALEKGNFNGEAIELRENDNLNEINKNGFYWAFGWAPNSPGKENGKSYGVLHFQVGETNALQVAFPYVTDKGYHAKTRRTIGAGQYSPWVDL